MNKELLDYDKEKNEEVGMRVNMLRLKKGLKSKEMAIMLNITYAHYSRMEAGTDGWSLGVLYKVAQILDVTVDHLLYGYGEAEYVLQIAEIMKEKDEENIKKLIEVAKIIL